MDDCGEEQWVAVQGCLEAAKSLRVEHFGMVSPPGANAIELITNTIGTLVDEGHLAAAWKLIHMCDRSVRVAVLDSCRPKDVIKLEASNVPKVSEARDRALRTVARKALNSRNSDPDFPLFFRLLKLCSPETRAAFGELLSSPTVEMAMDMDSKVLVEAVAIALRRIDLLDASACLRELDELLSIADRIAESNPANALVLKCLIWPLLTPERIEQVDAREHLQLCDTLRLLQFKAELPKLSPQLLEGVPADLQSELLRLVVAQAASAPSVEESERRLKELASLADEIGVVLATELNFHLLQAVMQSVHLTDEAAGDGFLKLRQELLGKTDAQEMFIDMPVELKGEFLRLLVEEAVNSRGEKWLDQVRALEWVVSDEFRDEYRHYLRQAGLELGSRSWANPPSEKPTREIVFENTEWARGLQERIKEGRLYDAADLIAAMSNATPAIFDKAAAELIDAVCARLEAIGFGVTRHPLAITLPKDSISTTWASVASQMSIVLLASMHPRCTEVAFSILAHEPARLAALPMLCRDSRAHERELLLRSIPGRDLVGRAVIDYLVEGNCSGMLVASLFKVFAHRVDLQPVISALPDEERSTVWASMFKSIYAIKLGKEVGYAEHLDQWFPAWRWLMLGNRLALGEVEVRAVKYMTAATSATVGGKPLYPDSALSSHLEAFYLAEPQWPVLEKLFSRDCQPLRGYKALAHALIRRLRNPATADANARRIAWLMVAHQAIGAVATVIGDDWAVIVEAAKAFQPEH